MIADFVRRAGAASVAVAHIQQARVEGEQLGRNIAAEVRAKEAREKPEDLQHRDKLKDAFLDLIRTAPDELRGEFYDAALTGIRAGLEPG